MRKPRLDKILVEQELVRDKHEAFLVVTEGRVLINGQKAVSPAQLVSVDNKIEVRPVREFVGRGAYKLEAALQTFGIQVSGLVCADIGAAAGGFTEVLLRRGAQKVYAIDAGRGKLDLKLREDPRVVVMEETNVLAVPPLPEPIDVITIDVSFTSLRRVLPRVRPWLSLQPELLYNSHDRRNITTRSERALPARVIALFKPQYEVRDKSLLKHGILRGEQVRSELVEEFRVWLKESRWQELGFIESPILGSEGNVEYLFHVAPV